MIECYEVSCPFHGVHYGMEGPFCNEEDCQFSNADMTEKAEKLMTKHLTNGGNSYGNV